MEALEERGEEHARARRLVYREKKPFLSARAEVVFVLFTQIFIVFVSCFTLGWILAHLNGFEKKSESDYPFNFHPLFMVMAMLAYAALPTSHRWQKALHALFHTLALISVAGGLSAVFKFHADNWIGILASSLFLCQYAAGVAIYLLPFASVPMRRVLLPLHRIAGITVYFLAIIAGCMGVLEKQTFLQSAGLDKFGRASLYANFVGLCFPLTGGLVGLLLYNRHYHRHEEDEEDSRDVFHMLTIKSVNARGLSRFGKIAKRKILYAARPFTKEVPDNTKEKNFWGCVVLLWWRRKNSLSRCPLIVF
ncbi:Cytochrome b561 domain-containing protein [Balamuthia mandrillaris]